MPSDARPLWTEILAHLKQQRWPILKVHLTYSALGITLLAPLVGALTHLLLKLSGTTVLADQEIAWFLLSPLGIASLILVVAVVIAIAALEQASLMAIPGEQARGLSRVLRLLLFAASRARRILWFTLLLVGRVLLLMLPFVAAGGVAGWLLLTGHDINYYLSAKPPAFWVAVVIVAVLALAMLVVVGRKLLGWSLALPLLLFADVPPARAFAQSQRLTADHRRLILGVLLVWLLAVLLLGALVLGAIGLVGGWVVPHFRGSLPVLALVLGGFALLWFIAQLLLTTFNAGSFAFALLALSRRCAPDLNIAMAQAASPAIERVERKVSESRLDRGLGLGLLVVVLLAGGTGVWLVNAVPGQHEVSIIAHRGAAGAAPENTLAAFERALDDGTDWIELDVQESADGEVIVVHDSDFMKLAGVDLKVWDGSLAQIAEIDIGSWFGPEFADQRSPTLRQVLDAAKGRAQVVIELKYYGHDQQLEQRVVDVVEAADAVDRIAVMSLSYDGIKKLHALRPDWTVGLLTATAIGDLSSREVDFLAVNAGMASAGFIRRTQAAGKQVWVWTVNDAASMSRLMSLGVDGLITDEPALGVATRREQAELSRVERLLLHAAILFDQPAGQRSYRDESP